MNPNIVRLASEANEAATEYRAMINIGVAREVAEEYGATLAEAVDALTGALFPTTNHQVELANLLEEIMPIMPSTHMRSDCRYCQDYGTNCGREHTFNTRQDWVRSVAGITPASGQWSYDPQDGFPYPPASGQWEPINPRTGRDDA